MKGPDDDTPTLGATRSGCGFSAHAGAQAPARHPGGPAPIIDLDDSLIVEASEDDDAFEQ